MPEEGGRWGPHAAGGKGGRELGWGSASGGHPSPCVPGADGILCPHAQGPSPCRPQEPAGPPAPGTGGPSTATHGAGLAPPRPGPSGHIQDPLGQGTRQRAPHSDCTFTQPPGLVVPPEAPPLSTRGPAVARHPLRSTPSGVSAQPAPQTGHTGGSRGRHVSSGAPTSGQHDAQPALRASSGAARKDGGSETLKGLTQPAAPTETQNFKRRALRRAPGASDTWGAVLDPGTRQSSHWGDGAQTRTETRTAIRGRVVCTQRQARPGRGPSPRAAGAAQGQPAHSGPRLPQDRGGGPSSHVPSEAPGHAPSGTDRSVLPVPRRAQAGPSDQQDPKAERDENTPPSVGCSAADTALATQGLVAVCARARGHACLS